ncbi:hypothetical protein G9272_33900 [Streptomyces asoensis]|uniref:Uncharacterized protein n=1 Tax=Streptomyces asoensis TaxID=249586 RepID=A0A6M4WVY0_9ACTN|nr:hypothetical protein [Streptomyces asoensis]QJT04680.1 hypothetical protein G9272_33900 [Streptomyces asoensis]
MAPTPGLAEIAEIAEIADATSALTRSVLTLCAVDDRFRTLIGLADRTQSPGSPAGTSSPPGSVNSSPPPGTWPSRIGPLATVDTEGRADDGTRAAASPS